MTPEASTSSRGGGYDVATIYDTDGRKRSVSRQQYEKLPLAERIRLVLQSRVEFYREGIEIPPNEALKVSPAG